MQSISKGGEGYPIFVGAIPANSTKEALKTYFSQWGSVLHVDLQYKQKSKHKDYNQRTAGHCTVYLSEQCAVEAILRVPSHSFGNRTILPQRYLKGQRLKKNNQETNNRRVVIKNIPMSVQEEEMKGMLCSKGYSDFELAYFMRHTSRPFQKGSSSHCPRTQTFSIHFRDQDTASRCILLGTLYIHGTQVRIEPYRHNHNKQVKQSTRGLDSSETHEVEFLKKTNMNFPTCTSRELEYFRLNDADGVMSCSSLHYIKPTKAIYYQPFLKVKPVRPYGPENLRFNLLMSTRKNSQPRLTQPPAMLMMQRSILNDRLPL